MSRNKSITVAAAAAVIATAIGIVISFLIHWFPTQASTQAKNTDRLYHVLVIASIPIFVLVVTVILYSVWQFRMRPGEELKDGPPIHGNTRLEVVWTALPAILIVGLCGYAYSVLRSNEKTHPGAMVVNVTERQFAFQFGYPRTDGREVLSPELYLPRGRPVVFHLTSLDNWGDPAKLGQAAVPKLATRPNYTGDLAWFLHGVF